MSTGGTRPGPTNTIVDVAPLRVGHATRRGQGALTGTTVVLAGEAGMVAGVDVRGGGPGTRETDLLDPRNVVERVHAFCLTGGSAFGLAAADGVMAGLLADRVGLPMGGPGELVPLVPAAVLFDLGRGGDWRATPTADTGREAYEAATAEPPRQGNVGAGTGAKAGGLKGGVGSASALLPDGSTVAALLVCNALGEVLDPDTGELYARRHLFAAEVPGLGVPVAAEVAAARARADAAPPVPLGRPGMATTIGVIATDAALTKAQCAKVAGVAHDGLARAVRPAHSMFDGDTFFGASTTVRPAPDGAAFHALLTAAADCAARAIVHAILAAQSVHAPGGSWRCYRDAFASGLS